MKSLKYPDKKINYVMDLFQQNPLNAIKYLQNTKDLTKEEIENMYKELYK